MDKTEVLWEDWKRERHEPDDLETDKCVIMSLDGGWYTRPCQKTYRYICGSVMPITVSPSGKLTHMATLARRLLYTTPNGECVNRIKCSKFNIRKSTEWKFNAINPRSCEILREFITELSLGQCHVTDALVC